METIMPRNNPHLVARRKLIVNITFIFCTMLLLLLYQQLTFDRFYTRMNQEPDDTSIIIAMELPLSRLASEEDIPKLQNTGISCNSEMCTEVCIITTQLRINTQSLNIYIKSQTSETNNLQDNNTIKIIKPYPRKTDDNAMGNVQSLQIIQEPTNSIIQPDCQHTHMVPVIVFSTGGYSGNIFHSFNEIIIPLFLTSRHFRSQVKFLITDYDSSWVDKYGRMLKQLSSFEIVTTSSNSSSSNGSVHCFPGGVIGLKYHGFLEINSTEIPIGYEFEDFREFVIESYDLKVSELLSVRPQNPVVLLFSRKKTRMWLNEDEIVGMMVGLGFEVRVVADSDTRDLETFSRLVNSCHVMVGVHGAGFTNEVFLPKGAVIVQVVPLGNIDWPSKTYFAGPGSRMGLKNLEYYVEPEESSLYESYGRDDPVLVDPNGVYAKDFGKAMLLYFTGQNVRVNVSRFRDTMSHALELLG